MSEATLPPMYSPSAAQQRDLNAILTQLLKPNEMALLIEERYEAPTSSWMLTIARQGPQARWMRQRYRYDSAVDVLFFLGERPLTEDELARAHRASAILRAA